MFILPESTVVNRVIPKNSFENYLDKNQHKQIFSFIKKITWLNKLSLDTVNLRGEHIHEIQVFMVELKENKSINTVLSIISKSIPYSVIYIIKNGENICCSVSITKAIEVNPRGSTNKWIISSEWNSINQFNYYINLKYSLDYVLFDICSQIVKAPVSITNLDQLVEYNRKLKDLTRQMEIVSNSIKKVKHFKEKVQLNLTLKKIKEEITKLNQ